MSRSPALDEALAAAGGVNKVARDLRISPQAVSQWGDVPEKWVLRLAALTQWRVSPHRLRSDIYPHPSDGLPNELRVQTYERAAA